MHPNAVVDHLVVAGRDVEELVDAFAEIGLESAYGGEHGNGITHNYVIGLSDRSYLELLSTIEPGTTSHWCDTEIRETSGPAAWAVSVDDIGRQTNRLDELGFAVDGPSHYSRERPDGVRVEWDLTVVGDRMGVPLPFLIEDRTPRERRAPTTDGVESTGLTGIADVPIGVAELAPWIEPFERLFGCESPVRDSVPALDADAVAFDDAPVTLLTPRTDEGWLAERVRRLPNRPVGCVFATEGGTSLPRSDPIDWFGDELEWLRVDLPGRFGVLRST